MQSYAQLRQRLLPSSLVGQWWGRQFPEAMHSSLQRSPMPEQQDGGRHLERRKPLPRSTPSPAPTRMEV